MHNFLSGRRQHIVLNCQVSTWTNITAGAPQVFILGPLMFLIYINNLSEGLSTNAKIYADNTSLFSIATGSQTAANDHNKDLEMIHNFISQWKMNFNLDPTRPAQEVIFSPKTKKLLHPPLVFNNESVTLSIYQKHLGIQMVTIKINKTIRLLRKLQNLLSRLITI